MATRSATLAGWLTWGSGLKMPEPRWIRSVAVAQVAEDGVVGRQVRVLVEEVVLGDPHVLEARLVGGLDQLEVVHDGVVLGVGIHRHPEAGHVALNEDAELHHSPCLAICGWSREP